MRALSESHESDAFAVSPSYNQQYANFYYMRLQMLKQAVSEAVDWDSPHADRVLDVVPNKKVWVVGTIYREMKNKPNIIDDLVKINHGITPEHAEKYTTPQDLFYIEDEHGRMAIAGNALHLSQLVTGCVVAILGAENSDGLFVVEDVRAAGIIPPPAIPSAVSGKKIALVSGLLLDNKIQESPKYQLLVDFLSGQFGDATAAGPASNICRLVVAGGVIAAPPAELIGSRVQRPQTDASAVQALGEYIRSLALSMPVHLMPGEGDPTDIALPQQPLHKGLFAASADLIKSGALVLETNPLMLDIDGVKLLGSSGQPVSDLCRYNESEAIELLQKTLEWRHLCPTAPDTLCSYPFVDNDPFVVQHAAHVCFAGNQPFYASKMALGTRLLTVPDFASTGQLVLLDMESLETEVVAFSV